MDENSTGVIEPAAEVQENLTSQPQTSSDYPLRPDLVAPVAEAPAEVPVQAEAAQELNFRALREEVDRIKSERVREREDYQNNMALMRSALENRKPQEQPKRRGMFEDFGLKEDDVPTVRELEAAWGKRETEYRSMIEEISVAQANPDYMDVLNGPLQNLIKQKPHLAGLISSAPNKAQAAYELGKMYQQSLATPSPAEQQYTQPPMHPNAARALQNAMKPGTLAQAGGQGTLSQADYIANMSDEEFYKMARKNGAID